MGDRKWEDLPVDCLADIFSRVGMESLILDVPYVCKSWLKATFSPRSWQNLIFPEGLLDALSHLDKSLSESSTENNDEVGLVPPRRIYLVEAFMNFVIGRSHGLAIVVAFPNESLMTQEVLNCVAEGCPYLKKLVLPNVMFGQLELSTLVCKWKDLEALDVSLGYLSVEIVREISLHCKKFRSLSGFMVFLCQSTATAIASLLPNIEFLSLSCSTTDKSSLMIILKGCKKLVHLDVSFSVGFDVDDEIRNLASHITTFIYDGAQLQFNPECDVDEFD